MVEWNSAQETSVRNFVAVQMWKMDFVLSIKLRRRKVPKKIREVFYFLGMVYMVVANLRLHEFVDTAVG
jgi:hypothetical protein